MSHLPQPIHRPLVLCQLKCVLVDSLPSLSNPPQLYLFPEMKVGTPNRARYFRVWNMFWGEGTEGKGRLGWEGEDIGIEEGCMGE